ncbi:MAG: hypothetical protein COS99_08770 [Candidatus Omnitrophica bacterium CG07_land_8_20_14_0_80_42_15]|uniref:Asparagine synthetase domain-containing protein n=1 Tax=Candidatus Aquitaenariimonas noxiae TaxID=1974741 RepID=A0A2J0KQ74_9BACT|nr:MAG: hypothetical protein COS99_08770 [Candidatus Omnitrophica bacterium CG07_land_8_20_14_0_80_42_15]
MINVSKAGIKVGPSKTKTYKNDSFDVYWNGVIYIPGKPVGLPSIIEFINKLLNQDIAEICALLYGVFFMVVQDKTRNITYAFIDNSGLFKAYFSTTEISDSFLDLIKRKAIGDISPECIVEFLCFGNLYCNKTFFDDIKKIKDNEIMVLNSKGVFEVRDKKIGKISDESKCEILSFLKNCCESFRDEQLSVDLTGGADTRFIAALLSYFGMNFEVAISGTEGNTDIKVALEVAKLLNRNIYVTQHTIDTLEQDIEKLFIYNDGLANILTYHRVSQFQNDRLQRGVTLGLSGAGGELFKDSWWLQDFPFYNSSRIRIERLFERCIRKTFFPHILLSERLADLSKGLERKFIDLLNLYRLNSNTQTYDNIYYHFRAQEAIGRFLTNTNNYFIPFYTPLLELDLARLSFNLKRRERFNNMFHRNWITFSNLKVARLKTNHGFTVSSRKADMLADFLHYLSDKQKRLVNKIIPKNPEKIILQDGPDNPQMIGRIRRMQITHELIGVLKKYGILNTALKIESVSDCHLGSLITLGLLLKRMEIGPSYKGTLYQNKAL